MISKEICCLLILQVIIFGSAAAFVSPPSGNLSLLKNNTNFSLTNNASAAPKVSPDVIGVFLQVQDVLLRLVEMLQGVVTHLMPSLAEESPTSTPNRLLDTQGGDSSDPSSNMASDLDIPLLILNSSHISSNSNASELDTTNGSILNVGNSISSPLEVKTSSSLDRASVMLSGNNAIGKISDLDRINHQASSSLDRNSVMLSGNNAIGKISDLDSNNIIKSSSSLDRNSVMLSSNNALARYLTWTFRIGTVLCSCNNAIGKISDLDQPNSLNVGKISDLDSNNIIKTSSSLDRNSVMLSSNNAIGKISDLDSNNIIKSSSSLDRNSVMLSGNNAIGKISDLDSNNIIKSSSSLDRNSVMLSGNNAIGKISDLDSNNIIKSSSSLDRNSIKLNGNNVIGKISDLDSN
ncbi:hypothetical protein WDU94_010682 [Cyamophila willieti]